MYTKDRAHWLPESIGTVLNQKGVDLELLILDDGSTDNTPAVLADYASKHGCIRLFQKGDPHLFSVATGDYICSLPDDDWLLGDDSLARRARVLEENPELAFVFSSVQGHDRMGVVLGFLSMGRIAPMDVLSNAAPFNRLFIDCNVPWPSGMFRRTDLDFSADYPGEGALARDWFWWQRLSKLGDQAYLAQPTVSLRTHTDQMSSTEGLLKGGFLRAHYALWQYWLDHGHSITYRDWAAMLGIAQKIQALQDKASGESSSPEELLRILETMKPQYPKPRIGLTMIVKNDKGADETHVLERCLDSTYGLITDLIIVDSSETNEEGDVDDLARHWALGNDIKYHRKHIRWRKDFSEARNEAYALARTTDCEWLLLMDADEWGEFDLHEVLETLARTITPGVVVPMVSITNRLNKRLTFIRNILGWEWKGRLHEAPFIHGEVPSAMVLGSFENPISATHIRTEQDGQRSKNPRKLEDDIETLSTNTELRDYFFLGEACWNKARSTEPGEDRDQWLAKALAAFSRFTENPGPQKGMAYYTLLTCGRILTMQQCDATDITNAYLQAVTMCPTRVEVWGELAQYALDNGLPALARAWALACAYAPKPDPSTSEFLEPEWAQWKGLFLLIQALVALHQHENIRQYIEELLKRPLPDKVREQIIELITSLKS
jgi:glycosyltransferase involved in cell wall biosynthesis